MEMMFNLFNNQRREVTGVSVSAASDGGTQATGGSYGQNAVQINSTNAALNVAAFHRAVELRAKTMSQLVWEYQVLSRQGGNFAKATRGPVARKLNYLLSVQPNPLMSAAVLQEQSEICLMMEGNAVQYVERISGEIEAIWLCSSASYNPMTNTYCISYNGVGGVVSIAEVPARDIIHIRNTFTTDHGLTGIPTLKFAKSALSIAATTDKLTLDNAAKGGKLKLLVQEEKQGTFGMGRAAKKELEKITSQLNEDVYRQDVVLMNNIAHVTPISQNAQQQELLSSRQFSVSEIARLTGVPKVLLMDDSNSSYKSPEAATQEFLLRTIAPKIREWENEYNRKLLSVEDYDQARYHLCEKPLMRMDAAGQANIDKIHLETGVKTVNELRAGYDLPTVEGGDIHYISTNLAELGSEKLSGQTSTNNGEEGGTK